MEIALNNKDKQTNLKRQQNDDSAAEYKFGKQTEEKIFHNLKQIKEQLMKPATPEKKKKEPIVIEVEDSSENNRDEDAKSN